MNAGQRSRTIAASFAVVYLDLDIPSFPSMANPGLGSPAFPTAEPDQAILPQNGSSPTEDRESHFDLRKRLSSIPSAISSVVKGDGTVLTNGTFEYGWGGACRYSWRVPDDFKGRFGVQIDFDAEPFEVTDERSWHSME